jgi:hypothetical protein
MHEPNCTTEIRCAKNSNSIVLDPNNYYLDYKYSCTNKTLHLLRRCWCSSPTNFDSST